MTVQRPVLLAVDDEPEILLALEDLLEEEFTVLVAGNGEAGLALLRSRADVAVILSDQRMPGMTGDRFLSEARGFCRAEAILLTGYADLSAVVAAVNSGGISGYSHKPWDPVALLAMVRQAVARRQLQDALLFERALLDGLMNSTDDAMAFQDRDGTLLRLNPAAARRFGRSEPAECLGERAYDLLAAAFPAEVELVAAGDREAMAGNGRNTASVDVVRREGTAIWVQRLRGPLRDADGVVTGLVTLERDVSAERLAEERGRQADRMQALGTMAGGVAHDFNNLLTAVLGSLEIAQRLAGDDDRMQRLLGTAIAGAERGASLTQRLLSFSRQRDPSSEPVDVSETVRGMVDLLVRGIDRPGVVLRLELAPDLAAVEVEASQLELAVLNLCINARDAMAGSGTIVLRTRSLSAAESAGDGHRLVFGALAPHGMVVVEVEDRGAGMDDEVVARIFEPFFTTKEIGRGTGLGLSMVYGFVRQSGGAVRLRTAPGRGTSFQLCFPVSAPS